MMVTIRAALAAAVLVATMAYTPARADDAKPAAFDPKAYATVVDKAVEFLKSKQAEDGSWSKANSYGITGVVLTGVFKSGKADASAPWVGKGLKFIESLVSAEEGHICKLPPNVRAGHKNYLTCVNLMALDLSGGDYKSTIAAATKYLRGIQTDEKQGKTKKDLAYGGVGYGPDTRPDMSNTHFFLDVMKKTKAAADDPVFAKMLVFVSRCQNLKGEHNDQPWADKINDGSFIYVLAGGRGPMPDQPADAKRPGYGSMTFVGLKALADCGVSKDDPRYKTALEWVSKNYSVAENPGKAEGDMSHGYYYYLCMMAGCLDSLGIDEITDAKGVKHDWRAEMLAELTKKQRKDGSFANTSPRWMETNADLCTAFALTALSHCKPKAK